MQRLHTLQQKMRDEYLSFNKYMCLKNFKVYPFIVMYKKYLMSEGAYTYKIQDLIEKIKIVDKNLGEFCQAEILFLQGNFSQSLEILNRLKPNQVKNTEIYYLIHKNYIFLNEKNKADSILYELLMFSNRKKTWLYLANNVSSQQQFIRFKKLFFKKINIQVEKNIQIFNYYSEAALRSCNYKEALNIWIIFIKNIKNNIKPQQKKYFSDKNAEQALLNLKEMLDNSNIPFFLVSGTLLGCIRENKILPHDKDLDIGVFSEKINKERLIKTILYSGFFEILPTRISEQVKLKHHNGTYIDIFIHNKKDEYIWHYAAKIKWFNTPFNLKKIKFLNTEFLVPENTDQYLIENYGQDWTVPKVDFDSNFDTPNAVISNQQEMQIFYVRMLAYKYLHNDINSLSFNRLVENLSNEVIECLKQELILTK